VNWDSKSLTLFKCCVTRLSQVIRSDKALEHLFLSNDRRMLKPNSTGFVQRDFSFFHGERVKNSSVHMYVPTLFDRKKPQPGYVCFSVKHARADTIKRQMILIVSCTNF